MTITYNQIFLDIKRKKKLYIKIYVLEPSTPDTPYMIKCDNGINDIVFRLEKFEHPADAIRYAIQWLDNYAFPEVK
jgi:hypothetical protein